MRSNRNSLIVEMVSVDLAEALLDNFFKLSVEFLVEKPRGLVQVARCREIERADFLQEALLQDS